MDAVVLVEGYADVISLYQAGIENVVSTSGTALTTEQVHLLSRYTRNFFFLYDADSAGLAAMLRGIDTILDEDCDARIVQLPTGEDPDSYVRKHLAAGVEARLAEAVSFVDFITARFRDEGKLDSPEGKTQVIRRIVNLVARMDDPIRREFYIHDVAEKYGIYESVLYRELEKELKSRGTRREARVPPEALKEIDPHPRETVDIPREEKVFCELLLQAPPEMQSDVLHHIRIGYFHDRRIQKFLHVLFEQEEHEGHIETDALWRYVKDDVAMHNLLADMLMDPIRPVSEWSRKQTVTPTDDRRILLDAYKRVVKRTLEVEHGQLQQALRTDDAPEILSRFHELAMLLRVEWGSIAEFEDIPEIDGDDL
jgi:DNA primase